MDGLSLWIMKRWISWWPDWFWPELNPLIKQSIEKVGTSSIFLFIHLFFYWSKYIIFVLLLYMRSTWYIHVYPVFVCTYTVYVTHLFSSSLSTWSLYLLVASAAASYRQFETDGFVDEAADCSVSTGRPVKHVVPRPPLICGWQDAPPQYWC